MPDLEQVPFAGVEFADNPEPRCPCVLLLDTSGSMSGTKIAELNSGLETFAEELRSDTMAAKRVEVFIITFGPMKTFKHFVTADAFQAPTLVASGDTPMGGQATDSTGCKAGQYPGGRGRGSKRRPSGNRRDRATRRGGETHPERVLTSHWSSRTRRRKGNGRHGPHGRAASGTERPWLSTHGLAQID